MIKVSNIRVMNFEGAFRGLRNPMNSWGKSDSSFGIADMNFIEDYSNLDSVVTSYIGEEDSVPDSDTEYAKYRQDFENTKNWLYENGAGLEFGYSKYDTEFAFLGADDLHLAQRMVAAGSDERKFLRQIFVSMDIDSSLFWWKEMDTYKVGTTANSCSTMHKITSTPITKDCFSFSEDNRDIYTDAWGNTTSIGLAQDIIIKECETLRQKFLETKDKTYWRALIELLPCAWNQKRTWTANYEVLRNIYFARRNHKLQEWRDFCKVIESLPYAKELICYEKKEKE